MIQYLLNVYCVLRKTHIQSKRGLVCLNEYRLFVTTSGLSFGSMQGPISFAVLNKQCPRH